MFIQYQYIKIFRCNTKLANIKPDISLLMPLVELASELAMFLTFKKTSVSY